MENTKIKRYENIDLLKTIAIFMVIVLHSGLLHINFIELKSVATYIEFAIRLIMEGVPIFIIVNGFLIMNKKFDFKKHLRKTLNIFVLLIIWSFVYVIISSLIFNNSIDIKNILKEVITTNISSKYTGILWFLQSLIALYLLFPVIKVLHDSNKKIYNFLFIIVTIFTIGINFLSLINNIIEFKTGWSGITYLLSYISKFNIITNGYFVFYFMLGGYIFENKENLKFKFNNKKSIIIVIAGLLAWILAITYGIGVSNLQNKMIGDSFNYSTVFLCITLLGLYCLTSNYQNTGNLVNKIIESVGKNSLGIYLIHVLVIRILRRFIQFPTYIFMQRLGFTVLVFIASYTIVLLIKKIPYVNKLISL